MGTKHHSQQHQRSGPRQSGPQLITPRADDLPEHYCARCTAVRPSVDPGCPDCGQARPDTGWTPLAETFDPFLGRLLNTRYFIDKVEGHGSSSTVYRAQSHSTGRFSTDQRFAVKVVKLRHPQAGVTADLRARLEREVQAVGMLQNPHIVRVHEMLDLDGDWLALIMDHIDGRTLESCIDHDGPFGVARACKLGQQIANGLSEAHDAGMVHRDIKPANIMVEQLPDGQDFGYLLDFGVVHVDDDSHLTQGFLGTPMFASPEQVTGASLDPRSDLYSLGATLFYMLSGRAPFEGAKTLDILKAHINQKAPRLSEVCPDRDIPAGLVDLVGRMLAKSPARRPADLFEVRDALQPFVAADTTSINRRPTTDSPTTDSPTTGQLDFQERPRTAVGIHHDDADRADPASAGNPVATTNQAGCWRTAPNTSEVSAIRQSTSHGFERPSTDPQNADVPRQLSSRWTVQFVDHDTGPPPADVGQRYAFARRIRASAAVGHHTIAFVDDQNQVWTVGADKLHGHHAPRRRICSLAASAAGTIVGLADGTIGRLGDDDAPIDALFADPAGRQITAMSASRAGHIVLAGSADGELVLGRLDAPNHPWRPLKAARPVAALALAPDGTMFAVASTDGFVRIGRADRPQQAHTTLRVDAGVRALALSDGAGRLAVLCNDGRLSIYQLDDRRAHAVRLPEDAPAAQSLYFDDDHLLHGVCPGDGHLRRATVRHRCRAE